MQAKITACESELHQRDQYITGIEAKMSQLMREVAEQGALPAGSRPCPPCTSRLGGSERVAVCASNASMAVLIRACAECAADQKMRNAEVYSRKMGKELEGKVGKLEKVNAELLGEPTAPFFRKQTHQCVIWAAQCASAPCADCASSPRIERRPCE